MVAVVVITTNTALYLSVTPNLKSGAGVYLEYVVAEALLSDSKIASISTAIVPCVMA